MAFVITSFGGTGVRPKAGGSAVKSRNISRLAVRLRVSLRDPELGLRQAEVGEATAKDTESENTESEEKTGLAKAVDYMWPRVLLLAVAAAYGTNFGTVKLLDESVRPSASAALRFTLAMLAFSPTLFRAPRGLVVEGLKVGVYVFAGYLFQSLALSTTESNKIAFLSALSVIFVPLINYLVPAKSQNHKDSASFLAVALAVSGVAILELGSGTKPALGDFYGLLQGFFFSCGFVGNERAIEKYPGNALALSAAQLTTVALMSVGWYFFDSVALYGNFDLQGISVAASDPMVLGALIYTGLFTTAFAIGAENIALAKVSASEMAIVFSTEPFVAAAFSAYWLNESLSSKGVIGGVLIFAACLSGQFNDRIMGGVRKVTSMFRPKRE